MDQPIVRTEYTFGRAFGSMDKVFAALTKVKASAAAIADTSTFGHVQFYKAAKAAGIAHIFGIELPVEGRPTIFYATNASNSLSDLYGLTSLSHRQGGLTLDDFISKPETIAACLLTLRDSRAYTCPHTFLGVGPTTLAGNRSARSTGLPLLAVSDCRYPEPKYSTAAQIIGISRATTAQHLLTLDEWRLACPGGFPLATDQWRELCVGVSLPRAENIRDPMDIEEECRRSPRAVCLSWPGYEERLQRELSVIRDKGFTDYFSVISKMVRFAKTKMLVGPARGSAAGSLVAFLLDITDIDPIPFHLLFERFIDETRHDFPDIDLDFPDDKRHIVFEYLAQTYGKANVARLGTVNRFKAKSALTEVAKKIGVPVWEVNEVKENMLERSGGDARAAMCFVDTINTLEAGKKLAAKYPGILVAGDIEEHAKYQGVHAAGAIVCNNAVYNYTAVDADGVAQVDKKDAEEINLMKIDVLGLRTLSVFEETGIDPRNAPLDDQATFDVFNKSLFAGIFQFEGAALQSITQQLGIHSFEDLVSATSLARPGPLNSGGAGMFIRRRKDGVVPSVNDIFDDITKETYGIVLYQEQVMQILRRMGRMEWADVQILRRAMSKSLGLEFFERFYERFKSGALKNGLTEKEARDSWDIMIHFGSYGFNRSHAVAYALISYWCAWLKAHHPVEFTLATLRHSKGEGQAIKLLREVERHKLIQFIPFDPEKSEADWAVVDGKLYGGLLNIKGVGEAKAAQILGRRREGRLTEKDREILANPVLEISDLFPAQRQFGHFYADPCEAGCAPGSRFTMVEEIANGATGAFLVLAKLEHRDIRDLNETQFLSKRGGKMIEGNSQYLNVKISDDTGLIHGTVSRYDYKKLGVELANSPEGSWWLFRGNVDAGFPKLRIKKAKRIA